MKRKILGLLVVALSALTIVSCDQEGLNIELDPVNITHRTQDYTFSFDAADFIETKSEAVPIYETQVTLNIDSIINAQDGMEAVDEAIIKEVVVGILQPEGLDFDFINSVSCKVSKTQEVSNDIIVAQAATIPADQTVLTLQTVEANADQVSEIVRTGDFWIRVYVDFEPSIPQELIDAQTTVVEAYFNALIAMTLNIN